MSRPRVLVVGPGDLSAGGVRGVMVLLAGSSLSDRLDLIEVATHRDGRIWGKLGAAAAGLGRVGYELARGRPRLVYVHTASFGSFWRKAIASAMASLARRPYIVHIHGGAFVSFYGGASPPVQAIVRRTLRRAAAVVALSPTWAREIRSIVDRTVVAIPNPVRVPAEVADPRRRPARIVTLARLGEEKGSFVLVRAFARVLERHPDARLVLAGDGPVDAIRREARRVGAGESVDLPGWIDPAGRDALLAGASIFVLPSQIEGLPLSLLEAMSFALPVVVTPVGGIPDVVTDGVNGRLVSVDREDELAQALGSLLDDPATAVRLGAAARRDVVASSSIDVVARRVGDLIEECLEP